MRHSALVLSFILGLAFARPQLDSSQLNGLPACAQDAANAATGASGCSSSDTTCLCNSQAFKNAITTTILQACGKDDVTQALAWAETECGSTLTDAAASSSGTSSTTATGAPSGTAMAVASTTTVPTTLTSMTSIAGATNTAATMASSVSSMSWNKTTTAMMNGTACGAPTVMSATGAAQPAMYTGAAMNVKAGQGIMAAVVGVAGAIALL